MESPNQAAWLVKAGAPLEIRSSTYPRPKHGQILIKSGAVAMNPLECILQYVLFIFPHLKLPFIPGSDVAGTVVEVGANVTRFKDGDRVLGHAVGTDKRRNSNTDSAFQSYAVLEENLTSRIPDTMAFEDACVLPLGLSTAACALYQKDYLSLQPPSLSPRPTSETLIVWGASTSVGSNAVQLACASGYEVIATASPRNFEYVKKLGATAVFDYRSKSAVKDIIDSLKDRKCAGAAAIGDGSAEACIDILAASEGKKFVAQMSMPLASSDYTTTTGKVSGLLSVVIFKLNLWLRSMTKRVDVKFVFGSDLMDNEVSNLIYQKFLPDALAQNKYVAAPPPTVIGSGLERIQEALDTCRKGVSARKVVVSLP